MHYRAEYLVSDSVEVPAGIENRHGPLRGLVGAPAFCFSPLAFLLSLEAMSAAIASLTGPRYSVRITPSTRWRRYPYHLFFLVRSPRPTPRSPGQCDSVPQPAGCRFQNSTQPTKRTRFSVSSWTSELILGTAGSLPVEWLPSILRLSLTLGSRPLSPLHRAGWGACRQLIVCAVVIGSACRQ